MKTQDEKHPENRLADGHLASPAWLGFVREQVASLKFGTVQITVHDGRVVQVERLEKVRIEDPR